MIEMHLKFDKEMHHQHSDSARATGAKGAPGLTEEIEQPVDCSDV